MSQRSLARVLRSEFAAASPKLADSLNAKRPTAKRQTPTLFPGRIWTFVGRFT